MESEFLDKVLELSKEGNWRGVLKLNDKSEKIEARYLLWVWPSEDNLWFIRDAVIALDCVGVTSIGCGCGLLEWIIHKSTGLPVLGYEVNRDWWESKYSAPSFIKMEYCSQPPDETILDPEYALLFCYFQRIRIGRRSQAHPIAGSWRLTNSVVYFFYLFEFVGYFNNALAFRDYIRVYSGRVVIIIGPGEGKSHHTDPAPFDVQFENGMWRLFKFQEVKETKDFIAMYLKDIDEN